jgi:thioredoxin-like negative regulator of GroEL
LNDLHIRFADQGLEVIGLNIDEEREANIRSYAETLQVQFELGKVSGQVQHNIVRFTKFGAIPQALLFVNGRITAVFTGASPATLRLLKTEIEKVFNKSE